MQRPCYTACRVLGHAPVSCRAKRAWHLPGACKDGGEHVSALRRAIWVCVAVLAAQYWPARRADPSRRLPGGGRCVETRSVLAGAIPARESSATLFGWRVGEQGVLFDNLRYPVVWGSPRRKTLDVSKTIME